MQPWPARAKPQRADWLVGINATRAFSYDSAADAAALSLRSASADTHAAIIVDRENKIKEFKPRELNEIFGTFRAETGEYSGDGSTKC